mgnify:CR=1 FL=1
MTLLTIEDLRVRFPTDHGGVEVVKGLSFRLGRERMGIVGESGSGKSMTGRALLGLVPPPGRVTAGAMDFDGIDLRSIDERGFRWLRGARMSMVMQDPKFSLNPVIRIGDQIGEVLELHTRLGGRSRRASVLEVLESGRSNDPERVDRL